MTLRSMLADTRPLRHGHFKRLWWTSIVTVIGAQLSVVAVPAQIWALTANSGYVGLTGVFGLVPLVVFGLWGGAIADAHDRRRVLQVTTVGLIVTSFGLAAQALLQIGNIWLILVLFAMQQAFFAVNSPTRTAAITQLVPAEELPAANTLGIGVFTFGSIAGPLLGGVLIPVLGFGWLYLLDAVSLLATGYAVWSLPGLLPGAAEQRERPGLRAILSGFGYVTRHPVLLMSFVVDLIAMIFGMPRVLFPEIADVNFGGPPTGGIALAVLFAAMPAGAFLGTIWSGWLSRMNQHGRAIVISIIIWGGCIVVFGWAAWAASGRAGAFLVIAVVALALGGIADMVSAVFRQTMLQSAADNQVRGRLQGVFLVVVVGGPRIADLWHGWASTALDAGLVAALGGALVIVAMVLVNAVAPALGRFRA